MEAHRMAVFPRRKLERKFRIPFCYGFWRLKLKVEDSSRQAGSLQSPQTQAIASDAEVGKYKVDNFGAVRMRHT